MKNKKLLAIFLLALLLRIFRLGAIPQGFHADEARVGWNAYSILKTGDDDKGNRFALYYNTFGDYRPTGIFYATIPSVLIFGRNEFAVRLPSALIGALTVFPLYYLSLLITKNRKIALISSLILAILPWHIATSRSTSEVVISCFLILSSLVLLADKKVRLAFLFLATSFFFYHSARGVGPLITLSWIIFLRQNSKKVLIGFALTTLLAISLLLSRGGQARFNQVKLSSPSPRNILIEYFSYLNPNFFLGDTTKPFRYTTPGAGIVSIPIFILFAAGLLVIIKSNQNLVLILLFLLGPIPASLTLEDSPNLHRSFFMLPFFAIIAAIGLHYFLKNRSLVVGKIMVVGVALSLFNFFLLYNTSSSTYQYRNPQTKELALYLNEVAKNYDKIYVTNEPDSPYPWYAFFNKIKPPEINSQLQKQNAGRWEYQNIIWDNTRCSAGRAFDEAKKDNSLTKIMVIDNGMCSKGGFERENPEARVIKEFNYTKDTAFRIWEYIPTRI